MTSKRHGREFYQRIGSKGGKSRREPQLIQAAMQDDLPDEPALDPSAFARKCPCGASARHLGPDGTQYCNTCFRAKRARLWKDNFTS